MRRSPPFAPARFAVHGFEGSGFTGRQFAARTLSAAFVVLVLAPGVSAQTPVFVPRAVAASAPLDQGNGGRSAVVSRDRVGLRLDALFAERGVADRVVLNVESRSWVARFERLDMDDAGFRSWVGSIDGIPDSHVVFTERDGIVSGLINAISVTYQILTESPGTYLLERVDLARLPDEFAPIAVTTSTSAAADPVHAGDDASTFDVLMLYTPAARVQRGGTTAMQALVSQIISDTNTAFARSGITSRVRLAAAQEFALTESPQMSTDLNALRNSTPAQSMRDSVRADLVQLLVHSPDMSACGVGYLLTSLGTTSFPAYSLADISCAVQYTPTHEMGHNMGSHHAPEDGASGALFPYSYGFKDPSRGFRTMMAYGCSGAACGRVLNFSNPVVAHNGGATGTTLQNNARSINEAAATVANFRQGGPTPPTPPGTPTNLRSSVVGNSVMVAWDPVQTASAYVLQVGTAPGAANLFHASVGNTTSASGIVASGTYYWRVIAFNSAGVGPPSAESQFTVGSACVPPSAPRTFGYAVSGPTVTLSWSPPVSGSAPISYLVEAGSAAGLANLLVAPVGATTTVATTAPPGTYFVRVKATNACGTSAPSNEHVITVP